MKINQVQIAEQVGVDKGFVNFVLEGKRNPNTAKGMQVVLAAAEQHAEKCKAEYISRLLKKWKLHETIQHKRKYHKETIQDTFEQRHKDLVENKYKGVTWSARRNKWRARIMIDKKNYELGYFHNATDAAIAVEQAKIKLNHAPKY